MLPVRDGDILSKMLMPDDSIVLDAMASLKRYHEAHAECRPMAEIGKLRAAI